MKGTFPALVGLLLLTVPSALRAQYTYTPNSDGITITGYTGTMSTLMAIPGSINGLAVTSIGNGTNAIFPSPYGYPYDFGVSLAIPASVTNLANYAFDNITPVFFFEGNAPAANSTVVNQSGGIGYYLQGTTGWSTEFAGNVSMTETEYAFLSQPNYGGNAVRYESWYAGVAIIPATNSSGQPITIVGSNAFVESPFLNSVTIPATVTNIDEAAFYDCAGLTNVTMFDGLLSIGDHAFDRCSSLPSITIPEGVTSIGPYAFYGCDSLASIVIPASVNTLGSEAFAECTNLADISVESGSGSYSSSGGVLFSYDQCALIQYPGGMAGGYTISGGVSDIGDYAFYDCTGLTSVSIPAGVTNIGNYAFYGCANLTNVTIANGVANIGVSAFGNCTNLASIAIPGSVTNIGSNAFFTCLNLTNAAMANGVGNIGASAFCSCSSLTNVAIPGSVASVGSDAFEYCTSLANATVGRGVNNIGQYAFWDFPALVGAYFAGNAPSTGGATVLYTTNMTAYYLPGATGWTNTFAGVPTVLWNPVLQANGVNFGVQSNQFGFNITSPTNLTVAVEVCTNLANPNWTPIQTMTISNGSVHFSEPLQSNTSGRYYGLGFP